MPGKPWSHDSLEKLREAGYSFQERGKCLSPKCEKVIFWFITPKGKWMPFEVLPTDDATQLPDHEPRYGPHHATCPDARNFHRNDPPIRTEPARKGPAA